MPIRCDAVNESLRRTSGTLLTPTSTYAIMAWVRFATLPAAGVYNSIFLIGTGFTNNYDTLEVKGTTGSNKRLVVGTDNGTYSETVGTTAIAVNTWYHVALVRESSTSLKMYLNGALEGTVTQAATGTTATVNAIGSHTDALDARIDSAKAYNASKTLAQILQEMQIKRPADFTSLTSFLPIFPGSGERGKDYSGLGNDWTENGTLTDEDPPPVSYGAMPIYVIKAAAGGGTLWTVDVSGSLTSSGSLVEQINKVLAGSLTDSGLLQKQDSKLLVGTLTDSGNEQNQAQKGFTGTLTEAGGEANVGNKALNGILTSSGSIVQQAQKTFAGILPFAGLLQNQAQKILSGALTSSGAIALIKIVVLTISGTLTSAGSLINQAQKITAGSLSSAGLLIKQVGKVIGGSLTSSGLFSAIKTVILTLAGSLTSSGAIRNQPAKVDSGSLTSSGLLQKQDNKILLGSLPPSGLLGNVKTALLTIAGSLTSSGAIQKQVGKVNSGSLASSGGILKNIRTAFAGILNSLGIFSGFGFNTVIPQVGFDVADTRSYPILFDINHIALEYDRTHYPIGYSSDGLKIQFTGETAPQLYDFVEYPVYFSSDPPVLFMIHGSTMIYGD